MLAHSMQAAAAEAAVIRIMVIGTAGLTAATLVRPALRWWQGLEVTARRRTLTVAGGLAAAATVAAFAVVIWPRLTGRDASGPVRMSVPTSWSWVALVGATGTGAAHALAPGHGKTLMAAMLIEGRGGLRRAAVLSAATAASHTASIAVVALVTVAVSRSVSAAVVMVMEVLAGLLMAALGAALLLRHRGNGRARHDHGHSHGGNGHVGGSEFASAGQTLVAGVVGGLVPSPTALALLLSTVAAGRAGFGLLLVLAFSAGLASVLLAVGVGVIHGRRWLSTRWAHAEWFAPLAARLSAACAATVLLVGLTLAATAAGGA